MRLPRVSVSESARMQVLIGLMAFSVLAYIVLPRLSSPEPSHSQGSDSFSTSGLGHSLLAATLKEAGYEVSQLRISPRRAVKRDSLVILAEPTFYDKATGSAVLDELAPMDPDVLIVLPKRQLIQTPSGQVTALRLYSKFEVADFADAILNSHPVRSGWVDYPEPPIEIKRIKPETILRWQNLPPEISAPVIDQLQLIEPESTDMVPLVACDQGILAGHVFKRGLRILVLSDPDLIANHGYGSHPENADLAHELLAQISPDATNIYFDEIIHGHSIAGNFWSRLFEFPLNIVVLHGLLIMLLLLWMGTTRFGRAKHLPQSLKAGQEFLVDHVTQVILAGQNSGFLLQRYLNDSLREVAHYLHLESGTFEEMEEKLALRSQQKSLNFRPKDWRRSGRRSRNQLLAVANEIHQWKKEMMHGTAIDPRARRRRS